MARLALSCLGPLQVTLAGQPVEGFKSNKVRALLVYLMAEADRPHRREQLAGLLWPDWPDSDALSNLRYALSNLRKVIGDRATDPPFLAISRDSLQFNNRSDHWLDVASFMEETIIGAARTGDTADLASLEKALGLYQGSFLEGFSIKDSANFEEWILLKRHQIDRRMLSTLSYLVKAEEAAGKYVQAQFWARKQLEMDPWSEPAHRQLMRTLALGGNRSAALRQFEECRQLLREELGVEPSQQTLDLSEQIRGGSLAPTVSYQVVDVERGTRRPSFLSEDRPVEEKQLFVAREAELFRLRRSLELALEGNGQIVFVTGEAGSGKTALLQEFSRQALAYVPDLIAAAGDCNAYTGLGDPYLPFREILDSLTGDVEAKWAAGAISGEYARRLWDGLPVVASLLAESSPGLINTFVPGTTLVERVASYPAWPQREAIVQRLDRLSRTQLASTSRRASAEQSDLFKQYTRLVQELAAKKPLLIILDDLQWADLGSISLLFHLGRQLSNARIMLVGAYRLEEITIGQDGDRHPLEPVILELQREYGDMLINLNRAPGREFVEAIIDSEPNELTRSFRDQLAEHTRGHALFTVELLRDMQERGQLVRDANGLWIDQPSLDWERMPARVEAAIAERIGRLAQPLQEILQVASMEGEEFTAEIVARVLQTEERKIVQTLSSELDRKHRLVRPLVVERQGSRRVSRYRFRNYLLQKYLYDKLDEIERTYLHEEVGKALEELYGERLRDIAVQLAWHYQEAGIAEKAVEYLIQAAEKALRLSAFKEAVTHLNQGFQSLRDSAEKLEQELALQMAMGIVWQSVETIRAQEVMDTYTRARQLCIQTGKTARLSEVLGQIAVHHYVGAEYREAQAYAEEALIIAQQAGDQLLEAIGNWYLGFMAFVQGQFEESRTYLERVVSFYDPETHHRGFIVNGGKDAGTGALSYMACCLWILGYPDQALSYSRQAITLARELGHPFSLADTLCFAGCLHSQLRGETADLMAYAEELIQLAEERVPGWLGTGNAYKGIALGMAGDYQGSIKEIQSAVAIERSKGIWCFFSGIQGSLAHAQANIGHVEEGFITLEQTDERIDETGERYWEAELNRLRGELLLLAGDEMDGEEALMKAIEIARRQAAKSWELRAATSMARFWSKQGKIKGARELLQPVYEWFIEGFDTSDLVEARQLLEELSQAGG